MAGLFLIQAVLHVALAVVVGRTARERDRAARDRDALRRRATLAAQHARRMADGLGDAAAWWDVQVEAHAGRVVHVERESLVGLVNTLRASAKGYALIVGGLGVATTSEADRAVLRAESTGAGT